MLKKLYNPSLLLAVGEKVPWQIVAGGVPNPKNESCGCCGVGRRNGKPVYGSALLTRQDYFRLRNGHTNYARYRGTLFRVAG